MTSNIDPPLRRWSIRADEVDPIETVMGGIAALHDLGHLRCLTEWCARPEHYAQAAFGIEENLKWRNRMGDRVCVEAIVAKAALPTKIYRLISALGLVTLEQRGRVIPSLSPAELIATASDKEIARVIVAVLGFVDSPAGLISIDETTFDQPGYWPTEGRVRLALALHVIVRLRHRERWRWNLESAP